jgi:hypothetical protein
MEKKRTRYTPFFEKMNSSDALKIFGIDSVPSTDELKNLYRTLALKNHPDKGGSLEAMKDINQAYDVLKTMKVSASKAFDWEEIHRKTTERNKHQFTVMDSIFEEEFDANGILKYLQQFVTDELFISVQKKDKNKISKAEWESWSFNFSADVKIHNKDNTLVFFVRYYISFNDNKSGGLSYDDIDEKDILYNVDITSDIYYNNRKNKLGKRDYKFRLGHRIISNYEEVFPKAKLNKIFSGQGKKTFKKADFELGLKRELNVNFDKDLYFIYPFGKDVKFYISMYRSTILRQAAYSWAVIQALDPSTKKYFHPALRLPHRTMMETEESLRNIIETIHSFVKISKQKNLNPEEDSKELHKILSDLIEKNFPKNY